MEEKYTLKNNEDIASFFNKYVETNDEMYMEAIIDFIKSRNYVYISLNTNRIDKLLYQDRNGNIFLDLLIEKSNNLGYELLNFLSTNIDVVRRSLKLGNLSFLENTKEEIMFSQYENNQTFFEYLLNKNLLSQNMISRLVTKKEYFEEMKVKKPKLLCFLREDILFNSEVDNTRVIDYLFINDLVDKDLISRIVGHLEIIELCDKYNREDLLKYTSKYITSKKKDGKLILESLLDRGIVPETNCNDIESFKVYIDKKYYAKACSVNEFMFDKKVDDKTVLDYLLENGLTPKFSFGNQFILETAFKHKRYDIAALCPIDTLLKKYDDKNTFLDIVLDNIKSGYSFKIRDFNTLLCSKESLAQFYIAIARHGLINHANELTSEKLLNENKGSRLIDHLLRLDKDLTLNVILNEKIKQDFDVAFYLKSIGIEQNKVEMKLYSNPFVDNYLQEIVNDSLSTSIDDESEKLLEEFKSLMLYDGNSDRKLVDGVLANYRRLISNNNEFGKEEIKKLIEIKKNNPDFKISKSTEGSYFQPYTSSVCLEKPVFNTINHELGHAFYNLLTSKTVPEEYTRIAYNLRNNSETIKKLSEYTRKFLEIRDKVTATVDSLVEENNEVTEEEKRKIEEFLKSSKEEKRKKYLEIGYSNETLDILLDDSLSLDEYLAQEKRIKKQELKDAILRTKYGAFIAIGDIFDSILMGRYKSEAIVYDGNIVNQAYGHGINYYERGEKTQFDEVIANISSILKSDECNETIEYMRYLFGEELINFLTNYYYNDVLNSQKDLKKEEDEAKSI